LWHSTAALQSARTGLLRARLAGLALVTLNATGGGMIINDVVRIYIY
jgi:hypothetical protein